MNEGFPVHMVATLLGVEIDVRVLPGAGTNEIGGAREGALLVRVKAPPEGGKANAAVLKLLGKEFGVRKSAIAIIRGSTSRKKVISMEGITVAAVRSALAKRM